jgi:hypothetical protein
MSAVDGTWEVTVTSPMGQQNITMELATSGAVLSGTMTGAMGSAPIAGQADGDSFSFSSNITTPFPINIEVSATASGDELSGQVKTQGFGSFPMKGVRKA